MSEPTFVFSDNSKAVLWGESEFLVSMGYFNVTQKKLFTVFYNNTCL